MDLKLVFLVSSVAMMASLTESAPHAPEDAVVLEAWPTHDDVITGADTEVEDAEPDYVDERSTDDMETAANIIFRPLFRYRQIVAARRRYQPSSKRRRGGTRRRYRNPYYYYYQ